MFAYKTTVLENSFSIKAELSCETKTCRLVTAELRLNVSVNEKEPIPLLARQICGLTQQDGRTKRTAKRLYATNVTGLLLTCFVVIFTSVTVLCMVFWKKTCLKVGEVRRKIFSNKIIYTLVTQGLPSSFLSRTVAHATLSELNDATGQERKEDGKPCVTSVTIILLESTVRQTSLSFKVIPLFCTAHPLLRITMLHPRWRRVLPTSPKRTNKGRFCRAKAFNGNNNTADRLTASWFAIEKQ